MQIENNHIQKKAMLGDFLTFKESNTVYQIVSNGNGDFRLLNLLASVLVGTSYAHIETILDVYPKAIVIPSSEARLILGYNAETK